jgi:hypothetical protein
MRKHGWLLAVACLFCLSAVPVAAYAYSVPRTFGDEDPYPLACLDFSGHWKSDDGELLDIVQGNHCRWLELHSSFNSPDGATVTTIVPDDKDRAISGNQWKGMIRHRWNNKKFATAVETHRSLYYSDKTVTELVVLERVNENLLLESTYRKTVYLANGVDQSDTSKQQPNQEYSQRVFRRASAVAVGPKGLFNTAR